uniref:Quinone oxidoreductase n=1 Tax=Lygus hesperus TaxID=30085 RepID=A0A0A9Z006_LYGHE
MFASNIFRTLCCVRPKLVSKAIFVLRFRRTLCSKGLMKAVIINKHGGPEELHLAEVQRPSPAKSEVLVEVQAASVNPVDLFIREGAFSRLPPLPIILGKEVAGIVAQVGGDVKNVKEGDRVTCCLPWDGGYSEYAVCDERFVIPLSSKLTFAQGSTLYVSYFVAYRALITKCKIKEGERLFIHGASGGVGISAIQIAKSGFVYNRISEKCSWAGSRFEGRG